MLYQTRIAREGIATTEEHSAPDTWDALGSAKNYLLAVTTSQVPQGASETLYLDASLDGVHWKEVWTSNFSPAASTETTFRSVLESDLSPPVRGCKVRVRYKASAPLFVEIWATARGRRTAVSGRVRLPARWGTRRLPAGSDWECESGRDTPRPLGHRGQVVTPSQITPIGGADRFPSIAGDIRPFLACPAQYLIHAEHRACLDRAHNDFERRRGTPSTSCDSTVVWDGEPGNVRARFRRYLALWCGDVADYLWSYPECRALFSGLFAEGAEDGARIDHASFLLQAVALESAAVAYARQHCDFSVEIAVPLIGREGWPASYLGDNPVACLPQIIPERLFGYAPRYTDLIPVQWPPQSPDFVFTPAVLAVHAAEEARPRAISALERAAQRLRSVALGRATPRASSETRAAFAAAFPGVPESRMGEVGRLFQAAATALREAAFVAVLQSTDITPAMVADDVMLGDLSDSIARAGSRTATIYLFPSFNSSTPENPVPLTPAQRITALAHEAVHFVDDLVDDGQDGMPGHTRRIDHGVGIPLDDAAAFQRFMELLGLTAEI